MINFKALWQNQQRIIYSIIGLVSTIFVLTTFALCIKWNRVASDTNPTNYVGNFTGTDWVGYQSGTLSIAALSNPEGKNHGTCKILTDNDNYVAHNLIIPNIIKDNADNLYDIIQIGDSAFNGNDALTGTLILPSVLQTIGNSSFFACHHLSGDLIIPEGVTSIGEYAFIAAGFTGNLTIASTVETIGTSAFRGSEFTGTLMFKEGLKTIGFQAFQNTRFSGTLILPSSLTSISEAAFGVCEYFTALIFKYSNTTIATDAFRYCSGLRYLAFDGWAAAPSWTTEFAFGNLRDIGIIYSLNSACSPITLRTALSACGLPPAWAAGSGFIF
ncbi:MAG: leucine-rich repeat domain-containing protein [Mycoplasmataceae bacterium]|nr:leucine-rich repeat domain-containing protein [Mycoplasmataceae bacterium]